MVVSCINACGFRLLQNIFWLAFCSLLCWMLHYRLHYSYFISFPSVHTSLIMFYCYFLQSTVHLIHFTYRSPSRSYLHYLVAFILHGHPTMLSVSLFSQSRLWELATYECLQINFLSWIDIHYLSLGSGSFTIPCLFILRGKCSCGGLLGSSNCSVEISALVFCSIMLGDEGVLRGCLLPCSAVVGLGLCALRKLQGIRAEVLSQVQCYFRHNLYIPSL